MARIGIVLALCAFALNLAAPPTVSAEEFEKVRKTKTGGKKKAVRKLAANAAGSEEAWWAPSPAEFAGLDPDEQSALLKTYAAVMVEMEAKQLKEDEAASPAGQTKAILMDLLLTRAFAQGSGFHYGGRCGG